MGHLLGVIAAGLAGRDDRGQGLAEYALILALIAIVAIIALIFLGGQVSSILSTVGTSVSRRAPNPGRGPGIGGLLGAPRVSGAASPRPTRSPPFDVALDARPLNRHHRGVQ